MIRSANSAALTLTNTGSVAVIVSQFVVSGDAFSLQSGTSNLTLEPGQSVAVTVTFQPLDEGTAAGHLSLLTNAPGAPAISLTGVGVRPAGHYIGLHWDASSSPVFGYNIYRSILPGTAYTKLNSAPIESTSYVDHTVEPSRTYSYRVTSVDSRGAESGPSNEASGAVPAF